MKPKLRKLPRIFLNYLPLHLSCPWENIHVLKSALLLDVSKYCTHQRKMCDTAFRENGQSYLYLDGYSVGSIVVFVIIPKQEIFIGRLSNYHFSVLYFRYTYRVHFINEGMPSSNQQHSVLSDQNNDADCNLQCSVVCYKKMGGDQALDS